MGGIDRPHTQLVTLVPDIDSGTADGAVELSKRLSDQAQQLYEEVARVENKDIAIEKVKVEVYIYSPVSTNLKFNGLR
jgi:hypothetical protein